MLSSWKRHQLTAVSLDQIVFDFREGIQVIVGNSEIFVDGRVA